MSELRVALEHALGPLYRVEREVRPVGDFRLFVATQIPVGPELLIKVLPASVSLAADGVTLERELLLLADRLRHPRLVAPQGGGLAGSFIYHVRPFLEGTTLHAWMAKNDAVPLGRLVEILSGVLEGLAHAHAAGLAHGDLRAENVLLGTDGIALADVGVARLLGRAANARNDMVALAALVNDMLMGRRLGAPGEPLADSRTLPSWLMEWIQTSWRDAGQALAALRPPPRASGPRPSRPVV
jgi:serine/threonine-protein kinase